MERGDDGLVAAICVIYVCMFARIPKSCATHRWGCVNDLFCKDSELASNISCPCTKLNVLNIY